MQLHRGLVADEVQQNPHPALVGGPVVEDPEDILQGPAGDADSVVFSEGLLTNNAVSLLEATNGVNHLDGYGNWVDALR